MVGITTLSPGCIAGSVIGGDLRERNVDSNKSHEDYEVFRLDTKYDITRILVGRCRVQLKRDESMIQ